MVFFFILPRVDEDEQVLPGQNCKNLCVLNRSSAAAVNTADLHRPNQVYVSR